MSKTFEVPSDSNPDVTYTLDPEAQTCTCPGFAKRGNCKHAKRYGFHPKGVKANLKSPSQSQAVSALIKSTRLKLPDEAAYWLGYLHSFPNVDFRLWNRLLIMFGEDNVSIPSMWGALLHYKRGYKTPFDLQLRQVLELCKTENWYHSVGGRAYIEGYKQFGADLYDTKDGDVLLNLLGSAVKGDNYPAACCAFESIYAVGDDGLKTRMAELILALSIDRDRLQARQTIGIWFEAKKALMGDGNYTAQALARLFFDFGKQERPGVGEEDMARGMEMVAKVGTSDALLMPKHYLDGIHCAGNDIRFTGTVEAFSAMCGAYVMFGRVSPEDHWPPEVWQ